jgi:hypothetical protein
MVAEPSHVKQLSLIHVCKIGGDCLSLPHFYILKLGNTSINLTEALFHFLFTGRMYLGYMTNKFLLLLYFLKNIIHFSTSIFTLIFTKLYSIVCSLVLE